MARFNKPSTPASRRLTATSAVKTTGTVTQTFEGGKAYTRDAKGELFQLAVVNMVGQDTFYESADNRDSRYTVLVRQLAVSDPEWTFNLLRWLRGPEGNLRTASLVGAAEFVRARLDAMSVGDLVPDDVKASQEGGGWNRRVIEAVLQRADEPGEMLGYWVSRYGRKLPKPLKRGVADAAKRLYTQRGYLRYDSGSKGFRFADVLELVHAQSGGPEQDALYRYAVDDRHDHAGEVPELLHMVRARRTINTMSANDRHKLARLAVRHGLDGNLYKAAMAGQWEWLHSSLGDTKDVRNPVSKADQWRLVLPQLGYMALLRNLRGMAEAGLSYEDVQAISRRLADPDEVARSRQFPFRFWSAYQAMNGGFAHAIDTAFMHSMRNVPGLPGRTLVLVDTSASMTSGIFAQRSRMSPVQAAAVFGVALAVRNPGAVDLFGFASGEFRHVVSTGASAMGEVKRFVERVGAVGHGTDIHGAVNRQFKRGHHNRVFIISDMQTIGTHGRAAHEVVPTNVPIYGFNLGGYREAMMETGRGNRHEFGGLSDATFRSIPLLEAGEDAGWPWEQRG